MTHLPNDIDGVAVYTLPYDPNNKMTSSKDGRNWGTWVTSKRVNFNGIRRTANCAGGHICINKDCNFAKTYRKEDGRPKDNTFHFSRKNDVYHCKICGYKADNIVCRCKKMWEFEEDSRILKVYHYGTHNCTPKPFVCVNEDILRNKFNNNSKTTPQQAANAVLVDCVEDNANIPTNEFNEIVDSLLDKQKIKN